MASEKYGLSLFEVNINPCYPQGLKIYPQETKDTEKELDNIEVSVSNKKYGLNHFLGISKK